MRITKVHLQNFKRFTDLTIDQIPETAKLVLLIGANGSGKSSVFDGFDYASKIAGKPIKDKQSYYEKNDTFITIRIDLSDKSYFEVDANGYMGTAKIPQKIIGRSSIRIVPTISNQANPNLIPGNDDSPQQLIYPDTRFDNDLFMYMQNIDNALREPVFRGESADTFQIFKQSIDPLNTSLLNIFGETEETTIQIDKYQNPTPSTNGKLIFRKGNSKINYDLLSHGEKQVVILLLNFIVRREYYDDAIIFIDEMDVHLNTSLQYRLLEEIVNVWIPDNAQLWTASHALGFIDYARKSETAAIIDFDNLDFDIPQTLLPESKESLDLYDIAIPKTVLFDIFDDKRLIFCENKNAKYYNLLKLPKTLFVPKNNAASVFERVKGDPRGESLRDRDFINDAEIAKLKVLYPKHHILQYYCFENYLYHPDNINELAFGDFDKEEYIKVITEQKNQKLLYIVSSLKLSRQHYQEFKTDNFDFKDTDSIADDLRSDDFEAFYKYFSMKRNEWFTRESLTHFNLTEERLASTQWFKQKIEDLLNS